ncbi:hypothetical protein [Yunchengibacter salinarum]|uniref:hypothetical protein n=1 Tax=Yunchengibacter salinarum TaxID=3133399 RepID=UPI0035B634EA
MHMHPIHAADDTRPGHADANGFSFRIRDTHWYFGYPDRHMGIWATQPDKAGALASPDIGPLLGPDLEPDIDTVLHHLAVDSAVDIPAHSDPELTRLKPWLAEKLAEYLNRVPMNLRKRLCRIKRGQWRLMHLACLSLSFRLHLFSIPYKSLKTDLPDQVALFRPFPTGNHAADTIAALLTKDRIGDFMKALKPGSTRFIRERRAIFGPTGLPPEGTWLGDHVAAMGRPGGRYGKVFSRTPLLEKRALIGALDLPDWLLSEQLFRLLREDPFAHGALSVTDFSERAFPPDKRRDVRMAMAQAVDRGTPLRFLEQMGRYTPMAQHSLQDGAGIIFVRDRKSLRALGRAMRNCLRHGPCGPPGVPAAYFRLDGTILPNGTHQPPRVGELLAEQAGWKVRQLFGPGNRPISQRGVEDVLTRLKESNPGVTFVMRRRAPALDQ